MGVDWDHNAYYQGTILRELPRRSGRVLDVGCGAGSPAVRLAGRFEHVDAIDASLAMVDARRRTPANVRCALGDVMKEPLPNRHYDAIVSLTVLHHLPFRAALTRLAQALRPGGVLLAVGLPRTDLPRELPTELLATAGHRALGLSIAVLRRATSSCWCQLEATHEAMPKLDPTMSTNEGRAIVDQALPGSQVRRLVFWRYMLRWHRPVDWRARS